jgi:hypothetical protein
MKTEGWTRRQPVGWNHDTLSAALEVGHPARREAIGASKKKSGNLDALHRGRSLCAATPCPPGIRPREFSRFAALHGRFQLRPAPGSEQEAGWRGSLATNS